MSLWTLVDSQLSLIHTAHVHARARACTRVHVVIEHVDFYDDIHTDCSHARARTSSTRCCVNFAATARSITQYHAVSV